MKYRIHPSKRTMGPPRGGWWFREPATGWQSPRPSQGYDRTVELIQKHREANPQLKLPADVESVRLALEEQVAERLLTEVPQQAAEWLLPIDDEAKKKAVSMSAPVGLFQSVFQAAGRVADRLRQDTEALQILTDWVGDGGNPVPQIIADARAKTCIACPQNQPKQRGLESTVAKEILRQERIRTSLRLRSNGEAMLNTCQVCSCHLPLKVWVPLEHIVKHSTMEMPDNCWVRTEAETIPRRSVSRARRPSITVRRSAAFGDVIAATVLATKLNAHGYDVRFLTNQYCAEALLHHPFISEVVTSGVPDVDLDGTYEQNLERDRKDIPSLYLDAAQHSLKQKGVPALSYADRVPYLGLHPKELEDAKAKLADLPSPRILFIPKSQAWANRTIREKNAIEITHKLPGTVIWGMPYEAPKGARVAPGINPWKGFRPTMALIAASDMVVTVDTGPLHAAAALNKPIVMIEQCIRGALRLTDQTDWTLSPSVLACSPCNSMVCNLDGADKNAPQCQLVDPDLLAGAALQKWNAIQSLGVTAIIPVVKPNYGLLRQVIQGLRGQVDEIIVTLDGDAKPADVQFPGVEYVIPSTGKRIGYGRTMNRAVRMASHGRILVLNDDCVMDPGAVEKMKEELLPGVGVVGCLLRFPDGKIQHGGCMRSPGSFSFGHIDYKASRRTILNPVDMEHVTHAAALIRRDVFFAVRGYSEEYDCYCEDADMNIAIAQSGWRIRYTPHATGIHHESQSTVSLNKTKLLADAHRIMAKRWGAYLANTKPAFAP